MTCSSPESSHGGKLGNPQVDRRDAEAAASSPCIRADGPTVGIMHKTQPPRLEPGR